MAYVTQSSAHSGLSGAATSATSVVSWTPADHKAARTKAKEHRLYEYNENVEGKVDLDKRYKLSLTSNPRNLGRNSRNQGLGVYFLTGIFLMILLIVLSLISIYPIANNAASAHQAETFTLRLEGTQYSVECPRTVLSTWLTDLTYGAHCSHETHNSVFQCGAQCVTTIEGTLNNNRRVEILDAAESVPLQPGQQHNLNEKNFENATEMCKTIRPGLPSELPASAFQLSDTSTPTHCEYRKDASQDGDTPVGQIWVVVVVELLLLVWYATMVTQQKLAAAQINAGVITQADYTVYVRNLSDRFTIDQRGVLNDFFCHYGQVVTAAFITNVGGCVRADAELKALRIKEGELEAMVSGNSRSTQQKILFRGLRSWLYHKLTCGLKTPADALADTRAQIETLQSKLNQLNPRDLRPIGEAMVMYNYEAHANNCFRDHPSSDVEMLSNQMRCRRSGAELNGKGVLVTRPSEPSDILWENTDTFGLALYMRRALSMVCMCAIFAVGAGLQVTFEQVKQATREDEADIYGEPKTLEEDAAVYLYLKALSALAAGTVVAINFVVTLSLKYLNNLERHRTHSSLESWSINKLIVAHIINAAFVPIFVQRGKRDTWYLPGGLAEQAFYIQAANAVLPGLSYVAAHLNLQARLFAPLVHSQDKLVQMWMPHQGLLAERYANAGKSLILALLYGPILPISYPLALAGVLVGTVLDRCVMLRLAAAPKQLNDMLMMSFNRMILLSILLYVLLAFGVYFNQEDGTTAPFVLGLVMWLVFVVVPLHWWSFGSKEQFDRELQDAGTLDRSWENWVWGATPPTPAQRAQPPRGFEVYAPPMPSSAPPEYLDAVRKLYALPPRVIPANSELLPCQSAATGGAATAVPQAPTVVVSPMAPPTPPPPPAHQYTVPSAPTHQYTVPSAPTQHAPSSYTANSAYPQQPISQYPSAPSYAQNASNPYPQHHQPYPNVYR